MKRSVFLIAAAVLLMMAGTAMAAGTATMDVSAVVQGTCSFNSASTTLAFGALPTSGAGASVSTSIDFNCSNGTVYTMTDDDGLNETGVDANRMASTTLGTTEYIPYSIAYTSTGTGLGPTNPITLTIDGTVASGAYATNSPDVYQDTVTLTINP
jgi:spore coat protein U domain-containing protein, fimbrial subunit CupE1/2/3/6